VNALFVHGMGRSILSWTPTLLRFRAHEINPSVFGYSATLQDFQTIVDRLITAITQLSMQGEYIVVGHSLGGVMLRAAIEALPIGTSLPQKLFLLGSPIQPSQIAQHLQQNPLFCAVTGDCGQLLGSKERMLTIPTSPIPTVAIIGTGGSQGWLTPFGDEVNDGVVAAKEVLADWLTEEVYVPVVHTFLPSSQRVAEIILARVLANKF
jgi:pimeloyl-ACP methyl ester carboxylesterase